MFMAKKVVIDPGHGGEDPGASANGIVEKDYTLMISEYMANRLSELGIENALTRDSDVTLDSTTRPKTAQSLFGTGSDVILVSNHINAGGGDGAEIIYALRNSDTLSSKIANEFIKSGQNVRKYYQRRLPSNSSKDYYYMLRETPNNESIIVEYGFLDSTGDDVNQIKNNWKTLAEAVVRALADYIGVTYIPPEGMGEVSDNIYIVKKGDTLYGIANKYGVSVEELKRLNNLGSNSLSIGQVLQIPNVDVTQGNENIYVVKEGDTLYSIASNYGMSVDELKSLNNLGSNILSIGQQLVVDNKSASTMDTYTVKAGDTLYSIASKYGLSVEELKRLNNLTSDILSIGEVLNVTNSYVPSTPSNSYVVKKGDSLYSIARRYNISVDDLKAANNKTSNLLSIDEVLIIPTSTSSKTYKVKAGDSLWKIATNYGVSVNALKEANGLSSNIISIGQVLVIP